MTAKYVAVDTVLAAYSLSDTQARLFSLLVGCLADVAKERPAALSAALQYAIELGRAFNSLGADEPGGLKFMQAAHNAAKELHGVAQRWLGPEWHGIGLWLN